MDSYFFRKCTLALMLSQLALLSAFAGVREVSPVVNSFSTAFSAAGDERIYIVQMNEPPALVLHKKKSKSLVQASSAGKEKKRRKRFNPEDSEIKTYVDRLEKRQDAILRSVNADNATVYRYRYTFNGVAVKLTPRQAKKLRLRKGVTQVWEDRQRKVSTSHSPGVLGLLNKDTGLRYGVGLEGKDVIIGVVDSGIAPGHPSFSERQQVRTDVPKLCRGTWGAESVLGRFLCRKYRREGPVIFDPLPADWQGICQTGEGFDADDCNNKLIGARFFRDGFDATAGNLVDENEFDSPADADGHGTHMASIAAGNEVRAEVFGREVGKISGMAPLARVAVYKACWLQQGTTRASCSISDLLDAIESAVADGVDIINYSIGDLNDSLTDPDDLALLAAADAGILSVTPSGNDGPTPFTILSPATTPWVISTGATSRKGSRIAEGIRVNLPESLADDYESKEAGFTPRLTDVGPLTGLLILADDDEVTTPDDKEGTIYDACSQLANASEIDGNIALVQRGGCNFDAKIGFVQDAGAVAMVVFNNDEVLPVMSGDSALADIPAVIIGQADGQLFRDQLLDEDEADNEIEITLDKTIFIDFSDAGNTMASFSGRGPALGDPDFLKPDVVAPGVDILGGQAPRVANGFRGENYQYLSGTSQAVPHVAGIAALIKEAHPDWTPAELKSALMTTARQDIRKEEGGDPADPFDIGAGHIVPNSAINPGLLYDITTEEYDAYLCKVGLARVTAAQCVALEDQGLDIDARDLNLPSIAITELIANSTVTRTVRNPGPAKEFKVELDIPDSIEVEVSPTRLSLGTDQTAEYTVRFISAGAALNSWQFGSISWLSDEHTVYTPFAVRPAEIGFSDEVISTGATGSANIDVRFGYDGDYSALPLGATLPCILPDNTPDDAICTHSSDATVSDANGNSYEFYADVDEYDWITRFTLDVQPDNQDNFNMILRFSLLNELTDGNDDLDLYLHYCNDKNDNQVCEDDEIEEVATSQTDQSSDEEITRLFPQSGIYYLDVYGYATDGADAQFSVYAWTLDSNSNAGNLALSNVPADASAGSDNTIIASWQGLDEGLWLGGISHNNDGTSLGITVLEIDNNAFPAEE